MLTLRYSSPEGERRLALQEGPYLLGRREDCHLCLNDATVSRQHARVERTPDGWAVTDLGSRWGTKVNGQPAETAPLHGGDTLALGQVLVRVEDSETGRVLLQDSETALLAKGSVVIPSRQVEERLREDSSVPGTGGAKTSAERLARVSQVLTHLADFARALVAAGSPQEVLEQLLSSVFSALPARRAAVLLAGQDGGLTPAAFRQRDDGPDSLQVSLTIARKALEEGAAILTSDAQVDPRFEGGASIHALGLRSVACVPLATGGRTLGLLYLEGDGAKSLGEEALEVMVTLAGYGALALQQMEERTRADQKKMDALRGLTGQVAHEVNNAAAVLGTALRAAKRNLGDASVVQAARSETAAAARLREAYTELERAERALQSIAETVKRSRSSVASDQYRPEVGDLNEALRGFPLPEGLRLDLDPDVGKVPFDPELLFRAVLNAVLNARRAVEQKGPAGGAVTLSSRRAGDSVEVAVGDDGVGMGPEALERLAQGEPFTTKGGGGGVTGLGTGIIRTIMATHGGAVRWESEAGRGTRCILTLPG